VAADLGGKIPPYQVLSYTWGRAASNSWETLEGIPWKLRSSISKPPSEVKKLVLGSFTSRYVWVDMFCIPQDCPPAKAWEVSRQESIFRDARGGMAWLHQTFRVLPLYFGVHSWMQDIRAGFHHKDTVKSPDLALSRLEELLKDPWFQSTWTLQEALL
ncbi:heterokaryon incompatibility, partial [Hyaloscypha finlandica]